MTLKELLKERTDFDIAAYYLACCLGLIEYEESFAKFRETKHIYWTRNRLGDLLYQTLEKLVELEILDKNDDGYQWVEF